MSDKDKIKIYKNPGRLEQEKRQSYTPQYQVMGIEPEEYKSAIATGVSVAKPVPSVDNPRVRKPSIRQSYAEIVESPIGRGRGVVPNVGNNMEHTWASVDGEIVDDVSLDPNHAMVDNNDFVSSAALGISESSQEILPILDETINPTKKVFSNPATVTLDTDDILSTLSSLSEGDYLLLVNGVAVCSGTVAQVQEQARLLVFGEHEMCAGNPIEVDSIVVVKRIPIKIGLFFE